MAVGIVLALIIVAAIIIGAIWFMRTRHMLGHKSSGGVAFENPSYLREVNMDHIQVSCGVAHLCYIQIHRILWQISVSLLHKTH